MTLKLAKFCDDPKKISTKSSYPQKIFIFLKTPKYIEIQNFEPPKNSPSQRMCEISEYPPPPPPRYKSPYLFVKMSPLRTLGSPTLKGSDTTAMQPVKSTRKWRPCDRKRRI